MTEWLIPAVFVMALTIVVIVSNRSRKRAEATKEFLFSFWFCSLDKFESLVQAGADTEGAKSYGSGEWSRPLHSLATKGDDEVNLEKIRILLRNGASVDCLDSDGRTPLEYMVGSGAALGDHGGVASLLIAEGARIDRLNARGESLVHTAASNGRHRIVRALLEAGADVNAAAPLASTLVLQGRSSGKDALGNERRTTQGAQPIHFAFAKNSIEVVRVLLEHGADLQAKTADGVTPQSILEAIRARHDLAVAKGDGYRAEYTESLEALESVLARRA